MISQPASAPSIPPLTPRLAGIDLLRALAAILVVALHAAVPYMSDPLPGLTWSIMPTEQSDAVNLIGWCIDGFIMPLFFLISGYFAARLLRQRGSAAFRVHRLRRIGGPLLFACLVILPMDLYIWLTGWLICDLVSLREILALKIKSDLGDSLYGVAHLWFLQYLLIYSLTASFFSDYFAKWRSNRKSSTEASETTCGNSLTEAGTDAGKRRSPVVISLLTLSVGILVAGGILWWQPRIVIGFRHSWGPLWENLIYYLVPFFLGWFWDLHTVPRASSPGRWGAQLAVACLAFVWLWPELLIHLKSETIPVSRAQVPFLFAAFGLLLSTGLFGALLNARLMRIPGSLKYVSNASFWIYLFHHPIVALTQVNLLSVQMAPIWKFCLSTAIALTTCLLTYEGLVRRTWLGNLLNGIQEQRLPGRSILRRGEPIPSSKTKAA